MNITLKNGDKLEVAEGADCAAAAKAISEGLARAAVAAKVNGELVDLSTALKEGDSLEIVTLKDKEGLHVYRHTCAQNIFPTSKLAIGPVIDNGFYYDIDFKTPITMEDFAKIEAEMKKIVKSNLPIERFTLSSTTCPRGRRSPSTSRARSSTSAAGRTFLRRARSRRSN